LESSGFASALRQAAAQRCPLSPKIFHLRAVFRELDERDFRQILVRNGCREPIAKTPQCVLGHLLGFCSRRRTQESNGEADPYDLIAAVPGISVPSLDENRCSVVRPLSPRAESRIGGLRPPLSIEERRSSARVTFTTQFAAISLSGSSRKRGKISNDQEPSNLKDTLSFARYASTCPVSSSCMSSLTTSATRRSRSVLEALSTADAAAFSQDSLLAPTNSLVDTVAHETSSRFALRPQKASAPYRLKSSITKPAPKRWASSSCAI
jgi:hypothetical protein